MTTNEARRLKRGDEVHWADPDEGTTSRVITVSKVRIHGDMVRLSGQDGSYLECLADELTKL